MSDGRPNGAERRGEADERSGGGGNAARALPPMHVLLDAAALRPWVERHGRRRVREIAGAALDRWRRPSPPGGAAAPPSAGEVLAAVEAALRRETAPRLRPVINATGVVLHTGLGRAPLAAEALDAIRAAAAGYSNLEVDLEGGGRGNRSGLVAGLLRELTGAEAALVVNNNAGGVLLCLAALAAGREVLVSRGELVEIGGGFRVPEVLAQSGARLREVGTTNRTHLRDYAAAAGPDTAAILRVHQSNFRIVGFTGAPELRALSGLAHRQGVPLIDDLGSGRLGSAGGDGALNEEPAVAAALEGGADLVCFSGDKLLGGPQAGVLCGRADLVARCAAHPLHRALRVDKLTLAALQATLDLHARGLAEERVPAVRMLCATPDSLQRRAAALAGAAASAMGARADVAVVPGESRAGGGALPAQGFPTWLVAVAPLQGSVERFAARLRAGDPPVVGRVGEGRVLLDPRTLRVEDEAALPELLRAAAEGVGR